MSGGAIFWIVVGIVVVCLIFYSLATNLKEKRDNIVIERERQLLKQERRKLHTQAKQNREAIEQLAREKSEGFPWLADAYADYFELTDMRIADYLEMKPHPARKAAEQVKEIAKQRREAERKYRIAKYVLEYYEKLFPWLVDFRGEDIDDIIIRIMYGKEQPDEDTFGEAGEPARKWLTEAEYQNLPRVEKFQLALYRYWHKKKTRWEVGRDYERYVGYLYESQGFKVYYQGIIEGFEDLGRDLIATKDRNIVKVIQCKYWSQDKTIHEKHIFQLFGTVTAYRVDNPKKQVEGTFYTSTKLSHRAKQFANILGVEVVENASLQPYPSIKCNVSRRDGAKIYHLPFDQQYDRTLVEEERLECYVETVAEAEALGFRRAFRWHGDTNASKAVQTKSTPRFPRVRRY